VWLLDLGNTRLKLARADASGLGPVTALAHGDAGFDAALRDVLGQGALGEAAWLASVAPEALRVRVEAALEACGKRTQRAVTRAECAGVRIAYADPARLGVDRFLALLAARARGGDQLVVSFGSAITVDLLDARGTHHGGLIGIAPAHARQALAERFPALDRGGTAAATPAFGADTPEALAAGVQRQALGLVMAAWDDACARLGRPPALLVGGGDAPAFVDALANRLSAELVHREAMVLDGLSVYAEAVRD
jgi:type III pantothenate kinase